MHWVLVYSGGLDSTVLLYYLKNLGHKVHTLTFSYQQRHKKEIEAAHNLTKELGIEHRLLDLENIADIFGDKNALTSNNHAVPTGTYHKGTLPITWVPNRNMIFIALAGAWAVTQNATGIAYGAHAGDHPIYPDCSPDFVQAASNTLRFARQKPLKLWAPFLNKKKEAIVQKGLELGVPFEKTWSCYHGKHTHCGHCPTCLERLNAFEACGVEDPVVYEKG